MGIRQGVSGKYRRSLGAGAKSPKIRGPGRREAAGRHWRPLFLTQSSATLNAVNGRNVGLADYAPPSLLFLVAMLAVLSYRLLSEAAANRKRADLGLRFCHPRTIRS